MRLIFIPLLFLVNTFLQAQELIKNEWEQGYAKDGKKYSVWQYFGINKQPELVINHSTGKVIFISKDTTDYVIVKDGQWVTSKLDVHPLPVTGTHNFYQSIYDTLKYPIKDFKKGLEGKVVIGFEVDTLGATVNYDILKSIGGSCDSTVLAAFKSVDQKWIPAKIGKKKYFTRFVMGYEFRLKQFSEPLEHEDFVVDSKKYRFLDDFVVKDPKINDYKVYNFVEQQAEFPGGYEGLAKHLARNLKYPPSAARLGLEGKVFVKFIVEPDGSITNIEVLKGFSAACDQEAIRVVSLMPKWKPGRQSGRVVRSYFTQVIYFKLENWKR